MTKPRPAVVALLLFLLGIAAPAWCAEPAAEHSSADEAYVAALRGPWIMTGVFAGKPVTYHAWGEPVLKGAWLKLRMIDAGKPAQYQAEVFLGYDSKARDYIVHWLDQFGAAGARVVGTGTRRGQRLVVTFPYAEGAFRDTFTRNVQAGTWTLLLESRDRRGVWSTFVSYKLTRPSQSKPVAAITGAYHVIRRLSDVPAHSQTENAG